MSMGIWCKVADVEPFHALCTSCIARFIEGHRTPPPVPPRAVRPQSLAREQYEAAWRAKERLR